MWHHLHDHELLVRCVWKCIGRPISFRGKKGMVWLGVWVCISYIGVSVFRPAACQYLPQTPWHASPTQAMICSGLECNCKVLGNLFREITNCESFSGTVFFYRLFFDNWFVPRSVVDNLLLFVREILVKAPEIGANDEIVSEVVFSLFAQISPPMHNFFYPSQPNCQRKEVCLKKVKVKWKPLKKWKLYWSFPKNL